MTLIINLLLRGLILFFGLGGPVITVLLYASGENWEVDIMEIIIPIFIGYLVSIIIAVIIHFQINNFGICILASMGLCFFAYLLLSILFLFDISDPEEFMWLPVGLLFVCLNCSPMAFSASASTVFLLRYNAIIKNGKWKEWVSTKPTS